MLQILIFKPTLEFIVVQIILDNLINRLIWNKVVEVNRLSLDEWTIIVYLCNEIKELIKSGIAPLGFWEARFSTISVFMKICIRRTSSSLFLYIYIFWNAKHFCKKKMLHENKSKNSAHEVLDCWYQIEWAKILDNKEQSKVT